MFKNIIFDFDGTLIDSRLGIIKTFQRITKELISKQTSEKEIIRLIGVPLVSILKTLLNTEDETLIKKGIVLFKKYYNSEGIYQNSVYPGAKEILGLLKNQSCELFIVSNKIELFIDKILEQRNLKKYFSFIVGTDGTNLQLEKPNQVKDLLINYNLEKQKTVMIGDTENDIIAAKKNFILSIGVTWGYGSEDSLIKAKADKICHSPLELEQFIIKN